MSAQTSAPDTPITPATPSRVSPTLVENSTKLQLPFSTTYEEFEKFINVLNEESSSNSSTSRSPESPHTPETKAISSTISNIPDPKSFLSHLDSISHLERRLNYRFLELEAKLRFLRLLTAGTEINKSEILSVDVDSSQLEEKVNSLELQVTESKKIGKTLRKKIGKCLHQAEVRRCLEGKSVLEDEMRQMEQEIGEYRTYFKTNGLDDEVYNWENNDLEWAKSVVEQEFFGGEALLQKGVENLEMELKEMNDKLNKLERSLETLKIEDKEIDNDLESLAVEREQLLAQLKVVQSHELTSEEIELIEKKKELQALTDKWEMF